MCSLFANLLLNKIFNVINYTCKQIHVNKRFLNSSTSSLVTRLLSFHSQSESRKLCQPIPPTNSASVIHGNAPECEINIHMCVLYYILVISLIIMVKTCSWGTFNSDTGYPERVENVRFIPFPKPTTN